MKEGTLKHAVILGAFCLGFGLLLALTDAATSSAIEERKKEDRLNSLGQVIPPTIHDNNPVEQPLTLHNDAGQEVLVYRAMKDGKVSGVAYEIFGTGYAGKMKFMLGVGADGRILGVRVLAHKETPGLGDWIDTKKGDWILQFAGLSLDNPTESKWKVKKDGGQFDQFTGATITPRGVVAAVHKGLKWFDANKALLLEVN